MRVILAERIKQLRLAKKQTQDTMSKVLEISRANYGYYENGKILPPIDKLVIIAKHFNVTLDYLVGNEEKPTIDVVETLKQIACTLEKQKESFK